MPGPSIILPASLLASGVFVLSLGVAGVRPGIASATSDPAPPARQEAAGLAERVAGFLDWAHPAESGCAPPEGFQIKESWEGGLRARYTVTCGGAARDLEGVLQIRRGDGVWQVAGGYEAETERVETALHGGPPARGLPPPPENEPPVVAESAAAVPPGGAAARQDETPMRVAAPPAILQEARPAYPERLGRARMIGDAVVEILVDVSPDGRPIRGRVLCGPDPDLGVRRAATAAALGFQFRPGTLLGRPVRYFVAVEVRFAGLPQDSVHWHHRALFHLEALVSEERAPLVEARRRMDAGESFGAATAAARAVAFGAGDWGFVSAATLPAPVRRALHEADVGAVVGPLEAEGLHYLMVKRGEIYYGILPGASAEAAYRLVHEKHAPRGAALRRIIESDLIEYLAENRRHAYMNEAARLMGIRQSRAEAGQLLIHTDTLDESEVRMLGALVQASFRAHEDLWGPLVPLRPFRQQILVYALARRADHDLLHRLWHSGAVDSGGSARPSKDARAEYGPAGEYIPASRILSIPCEGTEGHLPVPTLVHEAIHMLNYERVYGAGVEPSSWFEEGLANYFGLSQVDADLKLKPGDIRRSAIIVAGTARLQFDPRAQLRDYLQEIRDSGPVSLDRLLKSSSGDPFWSGASTVRAYSASWTLVHFLLHGERRRHRDAFQRYAALEARGAGGPEAFARLFGPDLQELERAWHAYEDRL